MQHSRFQLPALGLALLSLNSLSCSSLAGEPTDHSSAVSLSAPLTVGSRISLEPVGRADFLRHSNYLAWIGSISSDLERQDSTFTVRAGLADASCVSFESVNYPNYFLRHANSRLQINANDGSGLYSQDATWCARSGLSGQGTSFESKNFPGKYFRHRNFGVWLDTLDNSALYKSDASWTVTAPNAPADPIDRPTGCDTPGLVWKTGNKTNFTSYPDPGSEECIKFSGCLYEGQFAACSNTAPKAWVQTHNIVAVFPHLSQLKNHDLCLKSGSKTIVVTAIDECADSDCSGCCTQNRGNADELIDIESFTDARFGVADGPIQWADLGPTKAQACP